MNEAFVIGGVLEVTTMTVMMVMEQLVKYLTHIHLIYYINAEECGIILCNKVN